MIEDVSLKPAQAPSSPALDVQPAELCGGLCRGDFEEPKQSLEMT